MFCLSIFVLLSVLFCAEGLSPTELELEKEIADARPNIEYEDKKGLTPLHVAAMRCHLKVVQMLFDFGVNPLLADNDGNTPLHLAAGCPNVTSYLIQFGSHIQAKNKRNETPLQMAVRAKDHESVSVLLKNEALTSLSDEDQLKVVNEALVTNDKKIIEMLKNCSIFFSNGTGTVTTTQEVVQTTPEIISTTPIPNIIPTKNPKPQRVPLKRPSGKELDLIKAAKGGFEGSIVDLCSEGMDPNFADVNDNNYTPLHLATISRSYVAMLTLIACGAKVDTVDRDSNTPLHIAAMRNDSWGAAVLLMRGADPYIKQKNGKTAYQVVKENQDIGTLSVFNDKLLAWYNDVRPLTQVEKELHLYAKLGRYASGVAKACLAGVNVNIKDADNKQRTALHTAVSAEYNGLQTVQMLVRCGGNVNARDAEGNTPLHLAAIQGKDHVLSGLLLHKADPFLVNFQGKTAHQLSLVSNSSYINYMAKFGTHRYEWFMNNKFL